MSVNGNEQIKVELTPSEAIVLFEFLSRFTHEGKLELKDQAEERVLWNIYAILEGNLPEPFLENYNELLARAREVIRDETE